jgi:hypothetical protein
MRSTRKLFPHGYSWRSVARQPCSFYIVRRGPLEAAEERKAIARLTGGLRKQLDTGMIEPVWG